MIAIISNVFGRCKFLFALGLIAQTFLQLSGFSQNLNDKISFQIDSLKNECLHAQADARLFLLIDIANLYRNTNYEQTIKYADSTLSLAEIYPDTVKLNIIEQIADIYFLMADYNKAYEVDQKILSYYDNSGLIHEKYLVLVRICETSIELEYFSEAEKYLADLMELADDLKSKELFYDMYRLYYKLNYSQGKYDEAIQYYKLSQNYKDTIKNESTITQIAEIQFMHQTEKKEIENIIHEKDLLVSKTKQAVYLVSGLLFLIVMIILFLLLKARNSSIKKSGIISELDKKLNQLELEKVRLEEVHAEQRAFAEQQINKLHRGKYVKEIESKNNELSQLSLVLIKKNKVLDKLKKMLVNDLKIDKYNSSSVDILKLINENIDSDHHWQEFKDALKKNNPQFFDKIKQQFPDLSENEFRLCAYLSIGLSTKEIAELLNVTKAAVSKSRNRLRKKLELSPNQDLVEWARNI